MKDRFFYGSIAGILGGIASFIVNFGSYSVGWTTLVWIHFLSAFMMDRNPEGTLETLFFIVVQFIFLGILGGIFACLLPHLSSQHLYLKGIGYGIAIWFVLFSLPDIMGISGFGHIPFKTVVTNFIGSIVWGGSMAFVLKKIYNRILD